MDRQLSQLFKDYLSEQAQTYAAGDAIRDCSREKGYGDYCNGCPFRNCESWERDYCGPKRHYDHCKFKYNNTTGWLALRVSSAPIPILAALNTPKNEIVPFFEAHLLDCKKRGILYNTAYNPIFEKYGFDAVKYFYDTLKNVK